MSVPTISVVTPCRNQARYVSRTLDSVLDGRVAPDEYVVVDGGSQDGTAEIVSAYSDRLAWWVSEPDGGQYEAIEKGFSHTSGDVMGWLNGDDLYLPWTLAVVRDLFSRYAGVEWLTTMRPLTVDEEDRVVSCEFSGAFARGSFRAGANTPGGAGVVRAGIQQESTFWRRSLWQRAGGRLDTSLRLAGDFELWARFFEHAPLVAVDAPLAAFRAHPTQQTATGLADYAAEAGAVLSRNGALAPGRTTSLARRATYAALGRRPLRRLPRIVTAPLQAASLLHAAPTITWRRGGWVAARDWVV